MAAYFLRTGGMAITSLEVFPEPTCLTVGTDPTDNNLSGTWVWELDGNGYESFDRFPGHSGFWIPQWTDPRTKTVYTQRNAEFAKATALWTWVPEGGCTLTVEFWGAEGQGPDTYRGLGGYIKAEIAIDSTWAGQRLYFRIGEKPETRALYGSTSRPTPYGGGTGGPGGLWTNAFSVVSSPGYSGGGGTHVTITSKVNNTTEIPLVAAGGGGAAGDDTVNTPTKGGDGAYPTGQAGAQNSPSAGGQGGDQTNDGAGGTSIDGLAGHTTTFPNFSGWNGGGGGGWRGGRGGGNPPGSNTGNAGGGGSSGFTTNGAHPTVTLIDSTDGVQTGHGKLKVTMSTTTSRFIPKRTHLTIGFVETHAGSLAYKSIYGADGGGYPIFWLPDNMTKKVRIRALGEPGGPEFLTGTPKTKTGKAGYLVGDVPASSFPLHFRVGGRGFSSYVQGGGALIAQAAPWGFTAPLGAADITWPYGIPASPYVASGFTDMSNKLLVAGAGGGSSSNDNGDRIHSVNDPEDWEGGDSCWGQAEDGQTLTGLPARIAGTAGTPTTNGANGVAGGNLQPDDVFPGLASGLWAGGGGGGWKSGGGGQGGSTAVGQNRGAPGAGGVSWAATPTTFKYFTVHSNRTDPASVIFQFLP